jgi:hypothetical protein
MSNKNIFLALITIFTYLSFITCATEENISISKKTGDTVTSISTSISSEEEDDFENAIQFVVDKFLAIDSTSWNVFVEDLRCNGCTCNCNEFGCSETTKIILCKCHSNQIDIWKKLFSSECTSKKTKKPAQWIGHWNKWNCIYNSWHLVTIGTFYKYFYFYNSDHCKNENTVKKCGCKISKNATTECMEICLCKKHFEALEGWESLVEDSCMVK